MTSAEAVKPLGQAQWRKRKGIHLAVLILLSCMASDALAQLAPKLGYVFPPSLPVGKATDVQLGGFDFTTDMQWFVHDEHARLQIHGAPGDYHLPPPPYWAGPRAGSNSPPIPREVPGRLEVDAAAPAGFVRWQVANANGSSGTATFYVSRGPEIVESRSRDFPQRLVSLPVAISGRLSRLTEVDRYEWVADQDGPISVDLMARRLGSDFNGMVSVKDASGNLLADFADMQGLDGGLTFAARAGETYIIGLHDLDFRGDRAYVYRLAIERGPRVVCTIPANGQRGTSSDVEFIGLGLATGQPVMESIRQNIAFPPDVAMLTYTHLLETKYGPVSVPVPLSDLNELTNAAAATDGNAPEVLIAAPAAVTGRFPADTLEQRYAWHIENGERWSLQLHSRAIGGRLDVAMKVLGPDGQQIAENDDLPGTPDAGLEFQSTAGGKHTCVIRSMSSNPGAADDVYRLQLRKQTPDFSLQAPQQINIPLGGTTEIALTAKRTGGFDGEIAIAVERLPAGVVPEGDWKIPAGGNELKAVLRCAADVAVVAGAIQLHGTGQLGETSVTHPALATASGNLCPRRPAENQNSTILLSMTMPPPFDVLVVDRERQRDVPRGSTSLIELDIVRKDGFAGQIQIEMSAEQSRIRQGMRGQTTLVPAQETRVLYPCFMPEWLATDLTTRIVVHGVAAVPDPKGNIRQLTKPGDARITMILEGALLKVAADVREISVPAGAAFDVPVTISRSARLSLATTINLVVPDEVTGLLYADPLVLTPGQDEGTLHVSSVSDVRLAGPWRLKLTATALQNEKWPVVSETELPVSFQITEVANLPPVPACPNQ